MSELRIPDFAKSPRTKVVTAVTSFALIAAGCGSPENDDFVGGCDAFGVYAQNRWAPVGAAVREEPDVLSAKLSPSFAPNEVIAVDGWVSTGEPVYPTNPEPWNSDIWYHLANRDGWVSFAGVRAAPTEPDQTLRSPDGGQPAPTTPECEGTYQP